MLIYLTAYDSGPVWEDLGCLLQFIIHTPSGERAKMSQGDKAGGWADSTTGKERGVPGAPASPTWSQR